MRYGLPYKGSKNSIAKWIISQLPSANTFVDLFFGGGAVTHAALLSGKYKQFIVNDIDVRLPKLFLECIRGEHTVENHTEFVSREEFERKKMLTYTRRLFGVLAITKRATYTART